MLEQQGYPMKIYEDENAASFLTGAAYHNYGGDREQLNNVNGKFPDKEFDVHGKLLSACGMMDVT